MKPTFLSHLRLATIVVAILAAAPSARADRRPSAKEVVEKTYCQAFYQGDDSSAEMTMEIVDGQGRKQVREIVMLRRDETADACGDQQFYAYFKRPADVRKMRFLVWKETGKEDRRWLYLPALDLVKRIGSADKRTSFAGSHFTYEDVSGRDPAADEHELIGTTEQYYIVKSTPRNAKEVEFTFYKTFVHRKTFVAVKAEFYDRSGKAYRTFEVKKVETVAGFPTPTHMILSDTKIGGHSEVKLTRVMYDVGIPREIFTERFLRQIPNDYVR